MNPNPHSPRGVASWRVVLLVALLVLLPALGLGLRAAAPALASCGGTTLVGNEAALNNAITAFNSSAGPCVFTIQFTGDITLTADLTPINNADDTADLIIEGDDHTLDGDGNWEAIVTDDASQTDLTINELTIANAVFNAVRSGYNVLLTNSTLRGNTEGLRLTAGTGEVRDSTITGNESNGIQVNEVPGNGILLVRGSNISHNGDAGIFAGEATTIINSTLSYNGYAAVYASGNHSLTVVDSTMEGNLVYGLSIGNGAHLILYNSIVANSAEFDCATFSGGTVDADYSLVEDGSCGISNGVDDNITGQDPLLGQLRDNGGPTFTQVLLTLSGSVSATSPAIDSGDNSYVPTTTDQRGLPRPVNVIADRGAFEVQTADAILCPAFPITVTDEIELSDAIACYNAATTPGAYTIAFGNDIDLTTSTLPIKNTIAGVSLVIDGQGFTIDGQELSGVRPFQIDTDSIVELTDMTIAGGNVPYYGGGALNYGALTVTDVVFRDNAAAEAGGGIANWSFLTIDHSTFEFNSAAHSSGGAINSFGEQLGTVVTTITFSTFINNSAAVGGAIFAGYFGELSISESYFAGNTADFAGGAVGAESIQGSSIIANSTFYDNSADDFGGGVINSAGQVTINNSTFVDNSAQNGGALATGFYFCFTADVQVVLADGTTKRIADVVAGDELLSYDFATGETVISTVQATLSREVDEFLRINDLEVTAEHPFAVGNDVWRKAKELRVGDRVLSDDGWTTITRVERVEKTAEVYNINVDGPHNYYVSDAAGRYLVHNKLQGPVSGDTTVNNTILTGSTGGDCYAGSSDFYGSNNLLDDFAAGDCSSTGTAAVTNLAGSPANNGGPTLTFALLSGSNAVSGGNNGLAFGPTGALTTDQRGPGYGRVVDTTVDVGAYEFSPVAGFCPDDNNDVGYLYTDLLGTGQTGRTRKINIPNYSQVSDLYGQLAAVNVGVMKYVRFRYPNNTFLQVGPATSFAYRPAAVSWWGSELMPGVRFVKGQFFWGAKGSRSPRAFVLWPTYNTDTPYANVFVTFDESSENHVYWNTAEGWIDSQTQVISIPTTQAAGATVVVRVAIVDNNRDGRPVILSVSAGGPPVQFIDEDPNAKEALNVYEIELTDVAAGIDAVTLTLESPAPDGEVFPVGGDSAAMIGAAVSYACEPLD